MSDQTQLQRIRSVLNREWNPVGLVLSEEDDEYDSYVANITSRKWTEKELRDYLTRAESHNIGLSPDAERKQKITATVQSLMEVLG